MSDPDNVVVVNLRTDMSEVLGTVEEFQQYLRWRQTHSLLPARLPCDCGTPTVLRADDGHIQCARCGHEERKRQRAAMDSPVQPYAMHLIIQRAVENKDGGFISCGDIVRAFEGDTRRRYDEGRTRYDDYRALRPHVSKDALAAEPDTRTFNDIPDKG